MWQNDAHKKGLFLAAPLPKKTKIQAAREKILAFLTLRVCVFALNLAPHRKMWQSDAHEKDLFLAAPPAKKIKYKPRARAEGAREKNLAFLRLRVCVFALNVAPHRKIWQNNAHKKGLFLAAPPAKKIKTQAASARLSLIHI